MDKANLKSLVTGGCGFIGSHIVDELVSKGHQVIVVDDESAESNDTFFHNEKATYFKFSIADYDKIEPLFEGVDYVFHLAAESRIQPTLERPQDACVTNFVGTCVNVVTVTPAQTTTNLGRHRALRAPVECL